MGPVSEALALLSCSARRQSALYCLQFSCKTDLLLALLDFAHAD